MTQEALSKYLLTFGLISCFLCMLTSARDFNVTVKLDINASEAPSVTCDNLAPQVCCLETYDKNYTLAEFIGLNNLQLAMAWTGQDRPHYGYCGKKILKTGFGSGDYSIHTNLTALRWLNISSVSWGFSGDLDGHGLQQPLKQGRQRLVFDCIKTGQALIPEFSTAGV